VKTVLARDNVIPGGGRKKKTSSGDDEVHRKSAGIKAEENHEEKTEGSYMQNMF
jgi:hypothetical protein